ncbi:hypothetical protein LOK49_LG11G00671 [Camellia lanceoleosa]|uniref:Uncharacterized protein n=1 Tax=Camellia lanceoleosa TaxID=1840588 RepID=A0ACC0G3U2_9ERIC|nr:hypothetical protein LOK49_LG11G00671 [Camellia lanceoleosa]
MAQQDGYAEVVAPIGILQSLCVGTTSAVGSRVFEEGENDAKALHHIEGKALAGCLSWQKIQCQQLFHSFLSCPALVYVVIKRQLDTLFNSFKHRSAFNLCCCCKKHQPKHQPVEEEHSSVHLRGTEEIEQSNEAGDGEPPQKHFVESTHHVCDESAQQLEYHKTEARGQQTRRNADGIGAVEVTMAET